MTRNIDTLYVIRMGLEQISLKCHFADIQIFTRLQEQFVYFEW